MKKGLLLLIILGLIATVAFSQKRETRQVSGFTGIDASSVFDISVTKGDTESLTIEADNEVLQYVRSEVRNGVLNLYLDNNNKARNIKTLKASIVMKNLDRISLSGACKLTANDLFTSDSFKAGCSGVAKMTVNVSTGQLNLESSGSCNIQIKANVTGDANLNMSGTSKVKGELKAMNVKFNTSGVSSIELTGSANDIIVDVSGSSKIMAENFPVKNAIIRSSGTGKVNVNVSDNLKVNSSGTSTVNYKGSPVIEVNNSRMAKVRSI